MLIQAHKRIFFRFAFFAFYLYPHKTKLLYTIESPFKLVMFIAIYSFLFIPSISPFHSLVCAQYTCLFSSIFFLSFLSLIKCLTKEKRTWIVEWMILAEVIPVHWEFEIYIIQPELFQWYSYENIIKMIQPGHFRMNVPFYVRFHCFTLKITQTMRFFLYEANESTFVNKMMSFIWWRSDDFFCVFKPSFF